MSPDRAGASRLRLAAWLLVAIAVVLPRALARGLDPPSDVAPHAVRDEGFYTRNLRCLGAAGTLAHDDWRVSASALPHALATAGAALLGGGFTLVPLRLVSALSILAAGVLLAVRMAGAHSPRRALAFAWLFACDPLLLASSLHVTPHATALLASALALFLATRGGDDRTLRRPAGELMLAGAAAGTAAITSLQCQVLVALLGEALWSGRALGSAQAIRRASLYLLGALPLLVLRAGMLLALPETSWQLAREGVLSHLGDALGATVAEQILQRPASALVAWILPAALLALAAALPVVADPVRSSAGARFDRLLVVSVIAAVILPLPLSQQYPRYYLLLALAIAALGAQAIAGHRDGLQRLAELSRSIPGATVLGSGLAVASGLMLRPLEAFVLGDGARLPGVEVGLLSTAIAIGAVILLRGLGQLRAARAGAIAMPLLTALAGANAISWYLRWYLPGIATEARALEHLRTRFEPGAAVLALEADVLLLEAPVCPVSRRSTVRLAPAADGIRVVDAASGRERVRIRHALLLVSERLDLEEAYPEIAGRLRVVEWMTTSWDGDVVLLEWAPESQIR